MSGIRRKRHALYISLTLREEEGAWSLFEHGKGMKTREVGDCPYCERGWGMGYLPPQAGCFCRNLHACRESLFSPILVLHMWIVFPRKNNMHISSGGRKDPFLPAACCAGCWNPPLSSQTTGSPGVFGLGRLPQAFGVLHACSSAC